MPSEVLDAFADLSGWTTVASGHAQLQLSQDHGVEDHSLRLDFDFRGGGGFVVARKSFSMPLPETYTFSFYVRGVAPRNRFEFKLVDAQGHNVWWYHHDTFDFPADWQPLHISNRQIEFAWGPAGGGRMAEVGAIEYVIAAGTGGKGTIWMSCLRFEDTTYRATPVVSASSAQAGHGPQCAVDRSTDTSWRSAAAAGPQWLLLDFLQEREYSGMIIQWEPMRRAQDFTVQISHDGAHWDTVYAVSRAAGKNSYIYLPGTVSRYLRLHGLHSSGNTGIGIVDIEVQPYEFSSPHICKRVICPYRQRSTMTLATRPERCVTILRSHRVRCRKSVLRFLLVR